MTTPEQVEYLYSIYDPNWDELFQGYAIERHRITRKTPRRIYYAGRWDRTHHIDRQAIEANGKVWDRVHSRTLYLHEPELAKPTQPPTLAELKRQMADCHPDRGGTDAEFISARARYERARSLTNHQ